MDHFRLNKLKEADIDVLMIEAGGRRAVDDHSTEESPNADYLLGDGVVELKLFEEEGLEKATRQEKIARLFSGNQPRRPVVVLDPELLNRHERTSYYNALEAPIQTQVKKAARQLDATRAAMKASGPRVLFAVNNGYTALTHEEFLARVTKCAKNDTSRIDAVICAGCYYYSDGFEYFLLAPIDISAIRGDEPRALYGCIRDSWNKLVGDKLAATIRGEEVVDKLKSPVLDIVFEVDGIKYVKPCPPIGGHSDWHPKGRPRLDSRGLDSCPPVAKTFPRLSKRIWQRLKQAMPAEEMLRANYHSWSHFAEAVAEEQSTPTQLLVPVDIDYDLYEEWRQKEGVPNSFLALSEFACELFDKRIHEFIDDSQLLSDDGIILPRFVLLHVEEIGQDKALDICSIYDVAMSPGCERTVVLAENLNVFYEHGLALAAAYAIRQGVPGVRYSIDKTYAWH